MAALQLLNTTLFNDPNLISYWTLNGNSNDSKGTNNGTDSNIIYVTGQFGSAASTSGSTTSKISMPSPVIPIGSQTVLAWVKTTTADLYRAFVDTTNGASTNTGLTLAVSNTGRLYCDLDSGGRLASIEAGSINNGNFHFIAFTWDNSTTASHVISYIDGTAVGSATASGTQSGTATFNLTLGNYSSVTNQGLIGTFDDMVVFNRALSATEINNHWLGLDALPTGFSTYKSLLGVGI